MNTDVLSQLALKVSQYFRDFLESDFKRQQAPRRRIVLQSDGGFRSGMRVSPYPSLQRELWSLISRPSGDEMVLSMAPRKYTRPISPVMEKIVAEQINAIPEESIVAVRLAVIEMAKTTQFKAINDAEAWVDSVRETLCTELATAVIRPLIAHLDGPLKQQAYSVMDSLYATESEMIARVASDLDRLLPDALAKFLATRDPTPLIEATENFLTIEGVRTSLLDFFKSFITSDAFLEFRDVETFVSTGDSMQLYLYMGTLKYRSVQYPLFFLPINVTSDGGGTGYKLEIEKRLFANRRAIDFVLQELATGHQREWVSPIRERIHYLGAEQSIFEVVGHHFRQVAQAVDLGGQVDFTSTSPEASTSQVSLSSAMYISAYERSDESLVNDYEEIIDLVKKGGSAIVNLFEGMVRGVLMENPVSIGRAVADEWTQLSLVDRMVFDSPIPLNEEQRKILIATRQKEGRIIVVEGPPGTGKSHTITAIAADCALNKRSCLILSDKTEALDVVQGKLTDAMSRVRHDRDFPNPILRLGQQNANFRRLTGNQAISQIASFARATTANAPRLQAELKDTSQRLKDDISKTVTSLGGVAIADLQTMHQVEAQLEALSAPVAALLRAQTSPAYLPELSGILSHVDLLATYLGELFAEITPAPSQLWERVRRDATILEFLKDKDVASLGLFEHLDAVQLRDLSTTLVQYRQLKMPVFGYLFRSAAVRLLENGINLLATTRPVVLNTDADQLFKVVALGNDLRLKLENDGVADTLPRSYALLARGRRPHEGAGAAVRALALFKRMDPGIVDAILLGKTTSHDLWPLAVRFMHLWITTRRAFDEAPHIDYVGTKTRLEQLNTSLMNNHVDNRLLDFMDNHRSDARALASVIANRQKFPEEKFANVRESFPVIISSIREFGEYMPLLPDMFDVVIIDEASQVSVAQALPALLRARKVVVLGDSKQFSNVKASNASVALNDKYRADLVQFFERSVTREASALQRLSMFDVKKSILEFCSLSASYSIMLRKHFRSCKELISYSSRTFYAGQLQAIKIRGIPLDDVIRFDQVEVGEHRATRVVNDAEAHFILEQLLELLEEEMPPTVGVITPFREQQTALTKLLFNHPRGRDFEDKLRLKVWTFDTCQGEERGIIFYSMVATPDQDALNYVFPVDMNNAEESVEQKLKVQRLNVGFSRAQGMIWFVHSMPLAEYRGSIGQAMNHFANVLDRDDAIPDQTDASSPMEAKLLDWLQQTPFVQSNPDIVEILPQFPLGDYLRQLDPTYKHPAWRVDFLLTYNAPAGPVHIVIEYDGFEFHFQKDRPVNVGNYERYLVEADVERQLTLESYGYRFLRVNRFNLGTDPVETLSKRIVKLIEVATGEPVSAAVLHIQQQAAGLAAKDLKPCSRCGTIRPQQEFFDASLKGGAGGHGRVCAPCKVKGPTRTTRPSKSKTRRRRWN